MRAPRFLLETSIVLLVAVVPSVASAMPVFPGYVQAALMLDYTPPCTICHVGTPAINTAHTAFADAMQARGLNIDSTPAGVAMALAKMAADKVDSDHNGMTDVAELEAGEDPNTGDVINLSGPLTAYGCAAQLAPAAASWQGAAALGTALALGLGLTRRRRSPRGRRQSTPSPQV
jgi:hypothetical protein